VLNLTPLRTAHSAGVSLSTSAPITAISACVREEVRSGYGDYSEKKQKAAACEGSSLSFLRRAADLDFNCRSLKDLQRMSATTNATRVNKSPAIVSARGMLTLQRH
jgi:hypothetical protein